MQELEIVRKILNELNDSIRYCHWKSNQHFQDALKGIDDLDILIDRSQYEDLLRILGELDFKPFYIPYVRSYAGIEDYLGFDSDTGRIVHLHLHSRLVLGEKHLKGFLLPIEQRILENRVWDQNAQAYFSSPYDELLLLILRMGMKLRKRDIRKSNVLSGSVKNEFEWLKDNTPDFEGKLEEYEWLSDRIKKDVVDCYNGHTSWHAVNTLKRHIYADLAPYSQGGKLHNTLARQWHEAGRIILEIRKRLFHSKYKLLRRRSASGGVIVAFMGSDAAGKSTVVNEIRTWLSKVIDVRYFYLGSGDGSSSILRKPLKVVKSLAQRAGLIKKANNFSDSNLKEKTDSSAKIALAQKLWVYTLSKERITKLTQVSRCRNRGFVVLTDRYPQDEFDGLCDGRRMRGKRGFAGNAEDKAYRIARMVTPDLAIKLIVSPEEAVRRKPGEINYETSKSLTERVRNIQFSSSTVCVEIDAEQRFDDELVQIKNEIWKII